MRSVAAPGPAIYPARRPWSANPHWGWWVAGSLVLVAAAVAGGAYYWWRRRPPRDLALFSGSPLERVSCTRYLGHVICVWKSEFEGYLYNVDGGVASEGRYNDPVGALLSAKIYVAVLAGEPIPAANDNGNGNDAPEGQAA